MTEFLSVLGAADLRAALAECCADRNSPNRFRRRREELAQVPGTPFAYWLSTAIRRLFVDLPSFAGEGTARRHSKQGMATSNDGRFIRSWFEVSPNDAAWTGIAKGRFSTRLYGDIPEVVKWGTDGESARELKAYIETKPANKHWSRRISSSGFYGQAGVTWPVRASRFSPRPLPAGLVFSHRGYTAFSDKQDNLLALVAAMSSSMFDFLFKVNLGRFGFPEFLAGVLPRVPVWTEGSIGDAPLASLAREGWSLQRTSDTADELSRAFVLPALARTRSLGMEDQVQQWAETVTAVHEGLEKIQESIDRVVFDSYGLSDSDRSAVLSGIGVGDEDESDVDSDEENARPPGLNEPSGLAFDLVSWCVGVGVGRFDVRLATDDREWPSEPDPFDPLPVCSPGMLTGEDGLPLETLPEGYPVEVSDVLVDDPGHRLDITQRVRSVFDVVFDDPDSWWTDVGETLGAKRGEIGSWLSRGFFQHHLDRTSELARRAPILWPLGTASGSYTVWLYAHRVTSDSLFRVLNDVVSPKLALERRGLSELVQDAGPNPSAGQRKAIGAQEKLVGELEDLVGELTAVAPLWHPDLNDGVVILLAPLWRLFTHHKPWSKELRKHWDSLVAGEYDWAQLAMSLWPERVVPKCAEDRSLAIAHGLEEVLWVQDEDNLDKWLPRQTPTVPIGQLITERTDPATKAALEDAT